MEENNKFLPTLVNKIKYSRKVKVADIKSYLVDEFKLAKELTKENEKLRQDIEEQKIIEQKYDLTLVTLDEYKGRLAEKEKMINELKRKIDKLNTDIKLLSNENTDLKIKNNNISLRVKNIKEDGTTEFKKRLIPQIKNIKGHLIKESVIKIIEETKWPNNIDGTI